MNKDVKIVTDTCNFKFRVCGIVCIDDKILTVQMHNNGFYCLPGGHVELGEDTESAILREMKEELGYSVRITKLIAIVENFFNGKNNKAFHELGFYYMVEPINKNDLRLDNYTIIENDKGENIKLEFKWISYTDLKETNFKPSFLKDKLANKNYDFAHYIIK